MQISQSQNQTSFGLKLHFVDNKALNLFTEATKDLTSSKSMYKYLGELTSMKPKIGPDMDIFVSQVSGHKPRRILGIINIPKKVNLLKFSFRNNFNGFDGMPYYPEYSELSLDSIKGSLKRVLKIIDKDREFLKDKEPCAMSNLNLGESHLAWP